MNTLRQRGFNLLELMVAITVLGVLLGIGVPSFTQMMRTNRLAEQSNSLVAALSYARSEAVKRGFRVSACPGAGNACTGGTDWNAGILVFTDDTGTTGTLDGADAVGAVVGALDWRFRSRWCRQSGSDHIPAHGR